MPYSAFTGANPAAAKKGSHRPMPPSTPPMAGPKMNPRPKATPMSPRFLARFSGQQSSTQWVQRRRRGPGNESTSRLDVVEALDRRWRRGDGVVLERVAHRG